MSRRALAAALGACALAAAPPWAPPAAAQGFGASHDSSLPIEITSDRLEVFQKDRLAVFSGDVDAVQGEFVLSADELRVYYRGADDGRAAAGEQGSAAGGAEPEGAVRRIEASGNVFLSSPQETAQGEAGVYDVAGGRVTLDGAVVLTQNDNVIRGEHLELDLASGRSRVTGAATGVADAAPEQRVRAVFVPGDDDGDGGDGDPGSTE